jgi:hypothetical protein
LRFNPDQLASLKARPDTLAIEQLIVLDRDNVDRYSDSSSGAFSVP